MNIVPMQVILPLIDFSSVERDLVIEWLTTEAIDVYAKSTKQIRERIAEDFGAGELECRLVPDSWSPKAAITFEKRRVEFVQEGQVMTFDRERPVFSLNAIQQYFHRNMNHVEVEITS